MVIKYLIILLTMFSITVLHCSDDAKTPTAPVEDMADTISEDNNQKELVNEYDTSGLPSSMKSKDYRLLIYNSTYRITTDDSFNVSTDIEFDAIYQDSINENEKVTFTGSVATNTVGTHEIIVHYRELDRYIKVIVTKAPRASLTITTKVLKLFYRDSVILRDVVDFSAFNINGENEDSLVQFLKYYDPNTLGETVIPVVYGDIVDSIRVIVSYAPGYPLVAHDLTTLGANSKKISVYPSMSLPIFRADSITWTEPQEGSVTYSNYKLIYTPSLNFTGDISFSYKINVDGEWSNDASVGIKIYNDYVILDNFNDDLVFAGDGKTNTFRQTDLGAMFNYYNSDTDYMANAGFWKIYCDNIRGGDSYASPNFVKDSLFTRYFDYDNVLPHVHICSQCCTVPKNDYLEMYIQLGDKIEDPFYGIFCNLTIDNNYTDLSELKGITFYAKGSGTLSAAFTTEVTDSYGGGNMFYSFDLTPEWRYYSIDVSDLVPEFFSGADNDERTWDDCKDAVRQFGFTTCFGTHETLIELMIDDIHFIGVTARDFEWDNYRVQVP